EPVPLQEGTIHPLGGQVTSSWAQQTVEATQTELDRWTEAVNSGLIARFDARTMSENGAALPVATAEAILQNLQAIQLGLFEDMGNPNTGGSEELAAFDQNGGVLFHCVYDGYWFTVRFAEEDTDYVFDGSAIGHEAISALLEAQLPVPTPPQESALESSASQAPVPESSGEEPEEPEEEPATEPAPAPAPVQRPDYLGVGSPALRGEAEYLGDVEAGILDGINYEREDMGAAPVQWDDNLADAACIRAAELYHNKYTAHTRPNGERWITVVDRDVPVGYTSAGEILAFIGTAQNVDKIESADYWVNQWVNSSAHYECMINAKYTHAGSAVVFAWDQADQMYYGYACTIFAAW
ncbi:MAG: CAP domain-containing protein, partial [Oscillospiraceae bacterium]|nr:CAP domain-containing protein [Oscillospiraceae bacterium]